MSSSINPPAVAGAQTNDNTAPILLLYLIGVWLMVHWYHGIRLDAVYYAAQALVRGHPEWLGRDLFFAYGSQDDYTVFPAVYAWLAGRISLTHAALLLVGLAHAAWIGAALLIGRSLVPGFGLWLGLVLVFGTPGVYGASDFLSYGEGLATARILAEAASLIAFALVLRGQRIAAMLAGVAAFAMHPIIAFPILLVLGLLVLGLRASAMLTLAGLSLAGAAVWWGFLPSERISGFIDPEWHAIIAAGSPYIFLEGWLPADFSEVLCLLAVLGIATHAADGPLRTAWRAMLLVTLACLALALAGWATHHALLQQMQAWRVLWLTRIIASLAAAWLLVVWWPQGRSHRLLAVWLVIAWLARGYGGGLIAIGVTLAYSLSLRRPQTTIPQSIRLASWIALALVSAMALLAQTQQMAHLFARHDVAADAARLGLVGTNILVSLFGALLFSVLLIPVWRLAQRPGWRQWAALAIAAGTALTAAGRWDQRPVRERDLYSLDPVTSAQPTDSLPPNAMVYWEEDGYEATWVALQLPHYASLAQTAGVLFSRDTAIEARRRLRRLARLPPSSGNGDPAGRNQRLAGLMHLCHDPILDQVILSDDLGIGRPYRAWDGRLWQVHDCAGLRRAFRDPYARP